MKFDPKIHRRADSIAFPVESYVSYKGMSLTQSGGTYWLKLSALGDLKIALATAKLPTKFCTLLMNEKFRKLVEIYPNDDLHRLFFYSCFCTLYGKKKFELNSVDEEEADKALKKIDELLLLPLLKYA